MRSTIRFTVIAILVLAVAITANAQATRTWVSGVGDDANPCSRTAPCKTFAGAISKTANHGEISVLDPGGFGTVSITKSMTIDGNGQVSSILAAGTTGVIVNATSTDRIYLRNLTINGANTGFNGVRVIQGSHVTVENTAIWNFTTGVNGSRGIKVENSSNEVFLETQNVSIRDISGIGIELIPTVSGTARASINDTRVSDVTQSAVVLEANARAQITNSVLTHNAGAGVLVRRTTSVANIFNTVLSRNGFGVNVGNTDGGTARIALCQISDNTIDGLSITAPGTVISHGNNAIRGNVGNEAPSSNANTQ